MYSFKDKISTLKGVGKKTEECFHKLGIYTIRDLLEHYPRRYEQYPYISLLSELREGRVAVCATVSSTFYDGKNNSKTLIVREGQSSLSIKWFNSPYIERMVIRGNTYVFLGKVTVFNGKFYMAQPQHFLINEYKMLEGSIKPIYKLTSGITNEVLFKYVKEVLSDVNWNVEDIPSNVIYENRLLSLEDSIKCIHYPAKFEYYNMAKDSIVFREFYTLLYDVKRNMTSQDINRFSFNDMAVINSIISSLPYKLTKAQNKAISAAVKDMRSGYVAKRLFQGDVGCGKTIVAIIILSLAASNGYQGVLMAPTEVLAEQHFNEAIKVLSRCGLLNAISPVLLTGSTRQSEKKRIYEMISSGKANLIIGTHAVIQPGVDYHNLAVSIVDEQHRFGVEQRELLKTKSKNPIHSFIMTATPIPRTTAQILFGGLDITTIDEKPADRKPIINYVETAFRHDVVDNFMMSQISSGHQAYIICPMIAEDDDGKASVDLFYKKFHEKHPDVKAVAMHGKMRSEDKDAAMKSFEQNESKVMISTTVVEVGVNVPNATVMIIEDADMFGLLQLHQLRGRVGRGDAQSYCVFCSSTDVISEKLAAIGSTNDGFAIAEMDYKMRKAGDILGTRQSGDMGFKLADILADEPILRRANQCAEIQAKKDMSSERK